MERLSREQGSPSFNPNRLFRRRVPRSPFRSRGHAIPEETPAPLLAIYELPPDVKKFVHRHLPSIQHVEMLLAVAAEPERSIPIAELTTSIRAPSAEAAATAAADLERSGLVARTEGPTPSIRYSPENPAIQRTVVDLAVAYHERPVTLVRAVYDRSGASIQSFADAFRLRREGE